MSSKKIQELRDYYDNTSLADEIAETELNTEVVQSPMVGITVRVPADVLERVRQRARRTGVKTTALIRRWIEDAVDSNDESTPAARRRVSPGASGRIHSLAGIYQGAAMHIVLGNLGDVLSTTDVFKTAATSPALYPRYHIEGEGRVSV